MLLESKRSDASYTFSCTVEVSCSAGSQGRTSSQWIKVHSDLWNGECFSEACGSL